jgi:hypothetical protein
VSLLCKRTRASPLDASVCKESRSFSGEEAVPGREPDEVPGLLVRCRVWFGEVVAVDGRLPLRGTNVVLDD